MLGFKSILKYKMSITLFVLNCMFMLCLYGDSIQTETVRLCLLVSPNHLKYFLNFESRY